MLVDGSCKRNGNEQARGGVGVWFADGDSRNVSQRLPCAQLQTNQRAELTAALVAIERVAPDVPLEVRSDSRYLVLGATNWLRAWQRRNWTTTAGGAVLNEDLWKQLSLQIASRRIRFTWVRGHADDVGNQAANRLATHATRE